MRSPSRHLPAPCERRGRGGTIQFCLAPGASAVLGRLGVLGVDHVVLATRRGATGRATRFAASAGLRPFGAARRAVEDLGHLVRRLLELLERLLEGARLHALAALAE